MSDGIDGFLHLVTVIIEAVGVAVIVGGLLLAAFGYVRGGDGRSFHAVRATLARGILLGLEIMVAGDIISTVAIEPSLTSVAVLGAIVLIRTFLSLSLEVEVSGTWPWARHREKPADSLHAGNARDAVD